MKVIDDNLITYKIIYSIAHNLQRNEDTTGGVKYAVLIEGGRTRYAKATSIGKIGYHLHALTSIKPTARTRIVQVTNYCQIYLEAFELQRNYSI